MPAPLPTHRRGSGAHRDGRTDSYIMSENEKLSFATLNVNGLSNMKKRKALYNRLGKRTKTVFALQETHSTLKNQVIWEAQWKGKSILAHGESNSKGVAILFSKDLDVEIIKSGTVLNGRIVYAEVKKFLWLLSMYTFQLQIRKKSSWKC